MKWGFAWSKGPFEIWDDIGLMKSLEKMKKDKVRYPDWLDKMVDSGCNTFYRVRNGNRQYYCMKAQTYINVDVQPSITTFFDFKLSNKLIKKNWSASLYDLGDGVAGVELHSILKADLNPIDGSIMETIQFSLDWVEENKFKGLVISSDSTNFSAGANLNLILNATYKKDYESIEQISKFMQDICQNI